MHKEKILVDKLIHDFKTANPFEICELKNIEVQKKPLGSLNGIYRYHKRRQFITLNIDSMTYQQFMTCGHELYHALEHPKENKIFLSTTHFVNNKKEIACDRFSAYLALAYYGTIDNIPSRYLELVESEFLDEYIIKE